MEFPDDLRYHDSDTWVRAEADGTARVGVTDFAQDELGEIVWVELPAVGDALTFGESFGMLESSKTTADLHAPLSGEVVAVNAALEQQPGLVNSDPYGEGWIALVRGVPPETGLIDAGEYAERAG